MLDRIFFLWYTARMKDEDLQITRLWDIYRPLLTQTQREVTDLYFNCDLSLAEIAEEKGCSRQSVSDTLQKARRQIEEYEEKLHVLALLEGQAAEREKLLRALLAWAEERLSGEMSAELKAIVSGGQPAEAARRTDRGQAQRADFV